MIITDKYKLTLSNAKDTICLSIEEVVGEKWESVANIPLHYVQHAEPLWMDLNKNIDDCVMREEEAKDPEEKPEEAKPDYPDVWSGS